MARETLRDYLTDPLTLTGVGSAITSGNSLVDLVAGIGVAAAGIALTKVRLSQPDDLDIELSDINKYIEDWEKTGGYRTAPEL